MYFISDYFNNGLKGHYNYNFVDVAVNDDNLLFIDPVLIELAKDQWCNDANATIQSFFDEFYEAYRNNDVQRKIVLLSHAGEQNGTRLGYGQGDNGKGNTAKGLLDIFMPLENLLNKISTIRKAEDLPVLIPDFAEDGLSDLITNILHDHLNSFTMQQMKQYGIESNGLANFWTWSQTKGDWIRVERASYYIEGQEVLLVPKQIVRKKYLFSTNQYFNRIILEHMREEGGHMDGKNRYLKKML